MAAKLPCFKAYDIRGVYPYEIDDELAFALGQAIVKVLGSRSAVIGRDARLGGEALEKALAAGLNAQGASVSSIGLCGTEEIYHACATQPYEVGIMITGSHNPKNENGFKIVLGGAIPLSSANGLNDIAELVSQLLEKQNQLSPATESGCKIDKSHRDAYLAQILAFSGFDQTVKNSGKRLKILVDAGNGCAGLVLSALKRFLPFDFIEENYVPDGNFPNGVPNPLLPDRRAYTSRRVVESGADLGVAFDGDFDRCFFYDRNGNFLDGYYMVAVLAEELLKMHPGEKIIHDPRVYWNTQEAVRKAGGLPIMGKTGHAFMKAAMRQENALYGGEMSSHHYFRDFAYCDSGMLSMLLVLQRLRRSEQDLGEIVSEMRRHWPSSGEINFRVENPDRIMSDVWDNYLSTSTYQDRLDGINMELKDWRFNLRKSNTESLLRLNVESRGNPYLLEEKTAELKMFCKD